MTTTYCGHGFLEYLYCIISHLVSLKLTMPDGGNAVSLLDTLRLTVMGQMIRGLAAVQERSNLRASLPTEDE